MKKIKSSEITPERLYLSRRKFIAGVGALAASTLFLNACAAPGTSSGGEEPADKLTSLDSVIGYNNYYEFTTSKNGVDYLARNLKVAPWTVEGGGLARKPQAFAI